MHQQRESIDLVLRCALVSSTTIIIWKSLMLLTNCGSPIIISLSGDVEPTFISRGNFLLLTNYSTEFVRAGDIVVFRIEGRDIPIVHRVIKVHEKNDGYVKFLTKGDNNQVDDRGLYSPGQLWLERKDIIGKVKGYMPYIGIIFILMHDFPRLNYFIWAMIGFSVWTDFRHFIQDWLVHNRDLEFYPKSNIFIGGTEWWSRYPCGTYYFELILCALCSIETLRKNSNNSIFSIKQICLCLSICYVFYLHYQRRPTASGKLAKMVTTIPKP
ncbi:unnamed protein product [Rotaria sordida]|uniref:Signal peptidase complex catalytic subunit SEC11 n=1 Tax=Rotaria sordida TaxID=392033 RepID=A0A815D936_9BILA|nr:unnamed protein product [Rotaria sordida]